MIRLLVASVVFIGLLPGVSTALDISNITPRYGPLGAIRPELKCLPKDLILITYDLSNLTVDAKSGKAKYSILMELLNSKEEVIYSDKNTLEPILHLGGGKMPGDLKVQIGAKQAPGKYKIRLTVTDLLEKVKNPKQFSYPYEVMPNDFGFIQVWAPAFGVVGTPYVPEFALANFKLDKKNQPRAEVSVRVLDDKGVEVDSVKHVLPADLPAGADLTELNMLPFRHPMYLNRSGRFTVEIAAEDKEGNTKLKMSYPFTVLDINALQGK